MEWWSKKLKWDVVDDGVEIWATGAALGMKLWETKEEWEKRNDTDYYHDLPSFEVCRRPDKCDVIGPPSPIWSAQGKKAFFNARAVNAELGYVRLKINKLFPRWVAAMSYV